jgi:hypothetical protein
MHFMRRTFLRAPPAMGDYSREQAAQLDKGAGPKPPAIMEPIAHTLTQQQSGRRSLPQPSRVIMRTIRNMKLHPLLILGAACLHLVLLAIVLSVPDARGAERSSKGKGDVQAKLTYCEECHGSGDDASGH